MASGWIWAVPVSFAINAVDPDKPFFSGTGYRSFCNARPGDLPLDTTVGAWAEWCIVRHVDSETKGKKKAKRVLPIDPQLRARLNDLGSMPLPGSPTDFGKFIANETEKWARVVKLAGVKAD